MQSAFPSCENRSQRSVERRRGTSRSSGRTLLRTEIEAYELPKLMPTTVGMMVASTAMGNSALPFGVTAIFHNVLCNEKMVVDKQRARRQRLAPCKAKLSN